MAQSTDKLVFPSKPGPEPTPARARAWNILIADDDEEVHAVTKLVLRNLSFEGRQVTFLSAYSAAEARKIFESGQSIAVVLLDVVMESESSGLDFVKYLRDERGNHYTRIILRTGQPGQAPERKIIAEYDINDYKEKSELTSQKLFSAVMSALRSYRDILTIDESKRGLERIIGASYTLFNTETTLQSFISAVLFQLDALLQSDQSFFIVKHESFAAVSSGRDFEIVTGSSVFSDYLNKPITAIGEGHIHELVEEVVRTRKSIYLDLEYVGYFESKLGFETVLYLRTSEPMSELNKNLLHVFSANITLAFDNLMLNKDIIDTQKEIVCTIGDVVETRSKETANHVKRVAEYALLLAGYAGLPDEEKSLLYNASPMHDLGKIGIPDAVMLKPGPLDPEEWKLMKTHTLLGHEILGTSKRKILQTAGIISLQHHERWDGAGYPSGLAGEDIHIFARIIAIVDVFDALGQKRAYKEAWPLDKIRDHIAAASGSQFDPALTALFLEHFDEFLVIKDRFPDTPSPRPAPNR